MNPYKTSSLTLIALLALAGCPSDDTGGSGSDTDTPSTTDDPTTGPTSGPSTETDPDTTATDTDPDGTDTDTDTDTDTAADGAAIRVVHASPGAPAVDVYVMGEATPVIENLAYGETSDYLSVPASDYVFEIRATGEAADSEPAFTTDTLTLATGDSVTAIAAGQLGGEGDAAFRVLALADGFGEPGEGALARIVHAGSDAPAVDIDVGNDGTPELEGVAPYADSGAEGVALPAGEALQVGILAGGEAVTAFTTPELPAGAPLYIIATGLLGDLPRQETGFALLAVGPEGSIDLIQQNPRVYALHAGSDAAAVDICTGGEALLAGVEYGALAGIQVPPGSYTLDIHAAGDEPCAGDPAFSADSPAVEAGQQYLAVAAGELAEGSATPFELIFATESFTLENAATEAVAKVIHAAAAPDVNIGTVADANATTILGADALVTGLEFGEETSRDILVEADAIVVGVGDAADNQAPYNVLANFELTTPDGIRAWVLATGTVEPEGDEQPFALRAVVTGPGAWAVLGPIAPSGPNL